VTPNGGQIPLTQTDFNTTTAVLLGKDPFQIQQFNPTTISAPKGQVAVLTQVQLSLAYEFNNTIQTTFFKNSTTTVTAQAAMYLDLYNAKGVELTPNVVAPATMNISKTVTFPTTQSQQNVVYPPTITSGTHSMGYTNATTLAAFTGNGALTAPVVVSGVSGFRNNSGNGIGGSNTFASAALTVTYYYQFVAVPEPSSMVLMGLGGAGLGLVSRFRGRRKGLTAA
jgi:hypothetical protein